VDFLSFTLLKMKIWSHFLNLRGGGRQGGLIIWDLNLKAIYSNLDCCLLALWPGASGGKKLMARERCIFYQVLQVWQVGWGDSSGLIGKFNV
jgi:hypothetical protein